MTGFLPVGKGPRAHQETESVRDRNDSGTLLVGHRCVAAGATSAANRNLLARGGRFHRRTLTQVPSLGWPSAWSRTPFAGSGHALMRQFGLTGQGVVVVNSTAYSAADWQITVSHLGRDHRRRLERV